MYELNQDDPDVRLRVMQAPWECQFFRRLSANKDATIELFVAIDLGDDKSIGKSFPILEDNASYFCC